MRHDGMASNWTLIETLFDLGADKELMSHKERQDIELCAQRATLQQQRSHIEILESALTNAQLHIGNLEDEVSAHSSSRPPSPFIRN